MTSYTYEMTELYLREMTELYLREMTELYLRETWSSGGVRRGGAGR